MIAREKASRERVGWRSPSPCDPHGQSFSAPAATRQITTWLETGTIENFCDGLCDGFATGGGFQPQELTQGSSEPCDPL